MIIKTITYSESHELFSDFGLKKWKKLEVSAAINEEEDDQSAAKELKEKVQSMLAPELVPIAEALRGVLPVDNEKDAEITKAFEETKKRIMSAKSKEAAGEILVNSVFKLNVELKNIVNLKPSKNGNQEKK